MLKRLLVIALMLGAFGYGLTHLFLLRLQTGEVYPAYSSLRADPMGVKAFHDALRELPELTVERNLRPLQKLRANEAITLLAVGVDSEAMESREEMETWEKLAARGARVVICFEPRERGPTEEEQAEHLKDIQEARENWEKAKKSKNPPPSKEPVKNDSPLPAKPLDLKPGKPPEGSPAPIPAIDPAPQPPPKKAKDPKDSKDSKDSEEDALDDELFDYQQMADRWKVSFKYLPELDDHAAARRAKLPAPLAGCETSLSWHSVLHFAVTEKSWRTIYTCEGKPVVIERPYGQGSLVLASDSFFLSNEALRKERSPGLLTWVLGSARRIIFDEQIHDIGENPGVATLVRKYGLSGVAAGLAFLAALFIWKNSARFVPPLEEDNVDGDLVLGKEAAAGFINLLRRSIAPHQLIAVCAAEWRKAFPGGNKARQSRQLDALLAEEEARPPRQRNPLTAYQTISQTLSQLK